RADPPQLPRDHLDGGDPGRARAGRRRLPLPPPLAHAFAILTQFVAIDLGGTIAYWQKDPQKIIGDLTEVRPTYFPSVPRMFEKIYTLATSAAEDLDLLQ